nr:transposase [Hyalangium versicolor]
MRPGRLREKTAYDQHANTHLHANDRQGLERLSGYGARGAQALERLSRMEDGRIAYRMKRPLPDGTMHLPPGPREPSPCRAPHGRAARAGVYSKGLRCFSTRLAHCSGRPRQRPSSTSPLQPSPSTWPLSRLYASTCRSTSCSCRFRLRFGPKNRIWSRKCEQLSTQARC